MMCWRMVQTGCHPRIAVDGCRVAVDGCRVPVDGCRVPVDGCRVAARPKGEVSCPQPLHSGLSGGVLHAGPALKEGGAAPRDDLTRLVVGQPETRSHELGPGGAVDCGAVGKTMRTPY
jgi:hypothetical protein